MKEAGSLEEELHESLVASWLLMVEQVFSSVLMQLQPKIENIINNE